LDVIPIIIEEDDLKIDNLPIIILKDWGLIDNIYNIFTKQMNNKIVINNYFLN
jgi:hypothetical protein